ncbi:protein LAX PANICLE 2-like [Telopea speciosissima]|uniref:protein LAX PANICLE 2-like n=1 Tax=Telopea speciosissima TaxID=54955 RepID=UPI001CC35A69|nr:protein LAX PANICLE 2-like [Telopea speciosissima]
MAYIRVKEENVTVLIVKKYLVTKLELTNVSEIDISCMGQPLLHSQTLKYVRDVIWRPRLAESLNAVASRNTASLNHLMPLHYGKHCLC